MTTNVLDINGGLLASDSRWSFDMPTFVAFVDDTGFDKIVLHRHLGFMFAGNALLIQSWKNWLAAAPAADDVHPEVENEHGSIALSITDVERRTVLFEHGQNIQHPLARFAGTGARHAYMCWTANGSATRAVDSAKIMDWYSGGQVKYLRCLDKQHNLDGNADVQAIGARLLERGMVMFKGNAAGVVPLKEAAANDPSVEKLRQDIAAGKAIASAPCDAMFNPWTEPQKSKLGRVLSQALQIKK